MKPEDIVALLPSGEGRPAVTVGENNSVSLRYAVDTFAARASIDDLALRERFAVLSSEQYDDALRGGDGRITHLTGFVVRYVLAPKPAPATPKPPKSGG